LEHIIIIDCSVAEAVPEAIVKVSLDSAIVSAVVGRNSSVVAPAELTVITLVVV
jgi:hypothetical protein